MILREELSTAVERRAPNLRGPNLEARRGEAKRALELLEQFVAAAERLSVEHYHLAIASRDADPAASA